MYILTSLLAWVRIFQVTSLIFFISTFLAVLAYPICRAALSTIFGASTRSFTPYSPLFKKNMKFSIKMWKTLYGSYFLNKKWSHSLANEKMARKYLKIMRRFYFNRYLKVWLFTSVKICKINVFWRELFQRLLNMGSTELKMELKKGIFSRYLPTPPCKILKDSFWGIR